MTTSPAEQKIRRMLPVARLMTAYLPLPVMRWLQTQGRGHVVVPGGVERAVIDADGVACEWLIPAGVSREHVLLYLHGGGFVFGWTNMHRQMLIALAAMTGVSALAVDYRLAPEFPFPAALDDCVAAYRWLLQQGFAPEHILVGGDSAGGNLTLTTLLKLRAEGTPLPAAGVCLSPPTDFATPKPQIDDALLHPRAIAFFNAAYFGDHDPRDPLLSPLYADLRGLPPLLIQAGDEEMLRDDAVRLADAAQQAGVDVRLNVYPRMWHVWQIQYASLPQGRAALAEIARFAQDHLGLAPGQ